MMERFFSHGGHVCENVDMDIGKGSSDIGMMFWHGPPRCGKSSLALQYAFELVKGQTTTNNTSISSMCSVVLVLHAVTKGNALRIVPITPCGSCQMPEKSGQDMMYWQRIRIKYIHHLYRWM
jgi:hypothetical protein